MSAAAPPDAALSGVRMWLAGIVLAIGNFMVVLDTSIANVSVPHIAGSLAISPDQGTWVVTSYSVAEAICVPLTGWLVLRFGAVRTFIFSMVGFAFFSVMCGLSWNLGVLIAARIGQGLCGGPLMPLTQTLLVRIFPPSKRGAAMGMWAMTTVVAPVAGPVLGGTISDNLSWHWIFLINIPIAIICLSGVFALLRGVTSATERQPVDGVGLGLLIVWVGALQIMLDTGRDLDWFSSPRIVTEAVVAAIGFGVFVIWELTAEHPIVDIRVFRHRGFAAAVVALAVCYGTFFSSVVVTPQWLQGFLGYTASWAGFVLAWQGLFAVVLSPIAGRLSGRFDARLLVSGGMLMLAFGTFTRTYWSTGVDYWTLAIPHMLNGIGMPFFFVPITILSLGSVLPRETASAAGLSSFMRTLSGAVGTSIATTIWADQEQASRAQLSGLLHPTPDMVATIGGGDMAGQQARGLLERMVDQQAVALATVHLFEMATVLLILAASIVWLVPRLRRPVDTSSAH